MKTVIFLGDLGNQMTTYCLYKEISKKYDIKAIFTYPNQLEKIFNLKINENKDKNIYHENNFKLIKKILDFFKIIYRDSRYEGESIEQLVNDKKVYYYCGCWYPVDLIKKNYEEIIQDFIFPIFEDEKNLKIKDKIEETNSISLHIRRGDYLGHTLFGGICGEEYYQNAIGIILNKVKNPVFFIFSNDIEWCKKNLNIDYPSYYIDWNKGEESFRDMQLMSLCKHNIIPNSSFSWWGAWLNKNNNKIVIAPKNWINESYENFWKKGLDFLRKITFRKKYEEYKEIVPNEWLKI